MLQPAKSMDNSKVAIRVDASEQIGAGHLSRCLALADGLARAGVAVRFISRALPAALCELVRARGHDLRLLPSGEDASDWERDAQQTRLLLADEVLWSWIIVDHYGLDSRWESAVRSLANGVMAIDDVADRPHACEVLLDQNVVRGAHRRYSHLVGSRCTQLLGPRFALLRREFRRRRHSADPARRELRRLLIFFGGADQPDLTGAALNAVQQAQLPGLRVDVVVGAMNPHRARIEARCAALPGVAFHCQIDNMDELMARADVAIGAAGTASWERCCLGLPAVLVTLADNQVAVADGLAVARAAIALGPATADIAERLRDLLVRLAARPSLIRRLSQRAARLVDGAGVERVCFALLQDSSLSLRRAIAADDELAWRWRNAESTRRYSFDSAPIALDSHRAWWRSALSREERVLLIGELAGLPVGVLRFDLNAHVATVSIYLDPQLTGQGLGPALLRCGMRWLRQNLRAVNRVEALVKPENSASRKAFLAAGFQEERACFARSWPVEGSP